MQPPRPVSCAAAAGAPGKRKGIDWRLARFLGANLLLGAAAGWAFVAAILYFDIGGIGGLVARSGDRVLAVGILLAVMTITWGSAAMGTAVFLLPFSEADHDSGKRRRRLRASMLTKPALAPARIRR